ncbi:MAG: nickel insertion protein, partial [Endomicrobiia bacterium]
MKIAYFNCSSGISGDMLISSCLDCGIDKNYFEKELKRNLGFHNWELVVKKVHKGHFSATQINFLSDKKFKSIQEMKRLIQKS